MSGTVASFLPRSSAVETVPPPETFPVRLVIDDLAFSETARNGETVRDFLERSSISIGEDDLLSPAQDKTLVPNTTIILTSAKHYTIKTKSGKKTGETTLKTIGQLLDEEGISLGNHDLVTPAPEKSLVDGVSISVIEVDIRTETVQKPIPFDAREEEDSKLSWRKRVVTQKGEPGIREITFEVISHDGRIIKKTQKDTRITKEPVTEIATQGTKVETGKKHAGLASWYRFTGTLSAANPWLPIGSYVRVTNTENGKSVIVRINDRGPFGKGRIIDLDAVAFEKIARLGAGVVTVKMEEITN